MAHKVAVLKRVKAKWVAKKGRAKLVKILSLMKVSKTRLAKQIADENRAYAISLGEHQTFKTLMRPGGAEEIVKMGMVELMSAMKLSSELMLNPYNETQDFANYLNAMTMAQKSLLTSAKCLKEMEQAKITNDQTASQDQTGIPAPASTADSEEPR